MNQIQYLVTTFNPAADGTIQNMLTQAGQQGWQLNSVVTDTNGIHFVFSRPTTTPVTS
jgi:hypothetical protein